MTIPRTLQLAMEGSARSARTQASDGYGWYHDVSQGDDESTREHYDMSTLIEELEHEHEELMSRQSTKRANSIGNGEVVKLIRESKEDPDTKRSPRRQVTIGNGEIRRLSSSKLNEEGKEAHTTAKSKTAKKRSSKESQPAKKEGSKRTASTRSRHDTRSPPTPKRSSNARKIAVPEEQPRKSKKSSSIRGSVKKERTTPARRYSDRAHERSGLARPSCRRGSSARNLTSTRNASPSRTTRRRNSRDRTKIQRSGEDSAEGLTASERVLLEKMAASYSSSLSLSEADSIIDTIAEEEQIVPKRTSKDLLEELMSESEKEAVVPREVSVEDLQEEAPSCQCPPTARDPAVMTALAAATAAANAASNLAASMQASNQTQDPNMIAALVALANASTASTKAAIALEQNQSCQCWKA